MICVRKKYWQKRGRWLRKNPICHLPFYKCVKAGYPMNKRSKINWNYLLIAPALIISVCVILVPGIMTVVYSFTDWNGLSPDINFIGLQNYQELFHDNVFFIAIKNNFIWAIMFLTIPVVIGMLSAMLLLSRKKTRRRLLSRSLLREL